MKSSLMWSAAEPERVSPAGWSDRRVLGRLEVEWRGRPRHAVHVVDEQGVFKIWQRSELGLDNGIDPHALGGAVC